MVAERVPRQLAGEPVVLVQVGSRVREHEIRLDALQLLEGLLDRLAVVRHERVPEPVDDDLGAACAREERLGARSRLGGAVALGAEHDPRHLEGGVLARQGEQRPTASDLDVVRVAADGQHAAQRRSRRRSDSASIRPASARAARGDRRGATARDRTR